LNFIDLGAAMESSRRLTLAEFSRSHLEAIKSAGSEEVEQRRESITPDALDFPEGSFARHVVFGMLKARRGWAAQG
jgi:hypothetical protein